jgi:hypothetical protein
MIAGLHQSCLLRERIRRTADVKVLMQFAFPRTAAVSGDGIAHAAARAAIQFTSNSSAGTGLPK